MNFQHYKFSPSSLGAIMVGLDKPKLTEAQSRDLNVLLSKIELTVPQATKRDELIAKRDAEDKLSTGAITFVHNIVEQIYYGYKEEINSKYFDKGNLCEQAAIDYMNDNLFTDYVKFPEGRYENDYLISRGCDIKYSRIIRDVKNAWSKKTMPRFKSEIITHDYNWQGIGYMWLFDADEFHLDYVLMSTPAELRGYESDDLHDVEDLPFSKRYKTNSILRDEYTFELIKKAVTLARVEMQTYLDLLVND